MLDLARQLVDAIRHGRLPAGSRLPATRALAASLGVSRNTVLAAYEILMAQGLVISRRGSGTFVAVTAASLDRTASAVSSAPDRRLNPLYFDKRAERYAPAARGTYEFRIGIPDWQAFPFDIWRRLNGRLLRAPEAGIANYMGALGPLVLRQALARQIASTRSINCRPADIVVTAGAQQAFDLLARILVNRPGAAVAVEDPGYSRSREAFAAAGASMVPVEVDESGIRVEAIPDHVRVISVTPSHQYPLGAQLSETRRGELLAFAKARDAVIIEDDYDGEFQFRGRSLDALKTLDREDRVFYVGTFSKTLLPSFRLGYVIAPPWARDALAYAKQSADLHSSTLPQLVLAAFISEGHMSRHLAKMRRIFQARCERLVNSLQIHCGDLIRPFAPAAGLHLVARLPNGIDSEALAARCSAGGVALSSLTDCWAHQPRWSMIGLGYGGIHDDDIDAGVRRLRELTLS